MRHGFEFLSAVIVLPTSFYQSIKHFWYDYWFGDGVWVHFVTILGMISLFWDMVFYLCWEKRPNILLYQVTQLAHTPVTTCTPITNRSIWSSFNIVLKLNKHCQCLHGGEDSQLKFIATRLSCWICLLWSRGYSAQAKNQPPKFIDQSKESLKRNAGRVSSPAELWIKFRFRFWAVIIICDQRSLRDGGVQAVTRVCVLYNLTVHFLWEFKEDWNINDWDFE